MARSATRRCHLTLSTAVWEVLTARAVENMVSVSAVVNEIVRSVLMLPRGTGMSTEGQSVSRGKSTRRDHRLCIENALWDRMADEATAHGVSTPAWIRHRLRVAVLGSVSTPREGPVVDSGASKDQRDEKETSSRATQGVAICEF